MCSYAVEKEKSKKLILTITREYMRCFITKFAYGLGVTPSIPCWNENNRKLVIFSNCFQNMSIVIFHCKIQIQHEMSTNTTAVGVEFLQMTPRFLTKKCSKFHFLDVVHQNCQRLFVLRILNMTKRKVFVMLWDVEILHQ